jgi:hypothetical protein
MKKLFAASFLLLALTFNAQASTVDFEDTAANFQLDPFTSGGLTFTPISGFILTTSSRNSGSDNGTNALIAGLGHYAGDDLGGDFSFNKTDNSVFNLDSLDSGTTWFSDLVGGIGSVVITGHQLDGGTLSQTLYLNYQYANYAFGWSNLISVEVSSNSNLGYVAYDNINIDGTSVPVPAAVWLFGSALAGLVGVGKRKQAKA